MNINGVVGETAVRGNVDAPVAQEALDVQREELPGEEVDLKVFDKKEEGVPEEVMLAKTSHLEVNS